MLNKRRAQKHIRKMDLSEIRLKYMRKLTGYGAFSLPLALQDATRLHVSYSILVKEASRVKEKRIFRIKEVDFPAIDYSWMWWERNFYGFLEFYLNGLGNDQHTEALTDPDLSERLERGELHTLGRAYLCGHIRIHIRAKWASLAQARDFL